MEPTLPPSREGTVVLDIGAGIGALLLRTPDELLGSEPELTPLDGEGGHVHTAVRERRVGGDVTYAALYPALPAGRYRVDGTGQVVEIVSGAVTELDWDSASAPLPPSGDKVHQSHLHAHAHSHPEYAHPGHSGLDSGR